MLTRRERLKNTLALNKCMRISGRTHYVALLRSALRSLSVHSIQVSWPFEVSDVVVFPAMV